jgi:hypothetical protein
VEDKKGEAGSLWLPLKGERPSCCMQGVPAWGLAEHNISALKV